VAQVPAALGGYWQSAVPEDTTTSVADRTGYSKEVRIAMGGQAMLNCAPLPGGLADAESTKPSAEATAGNFNSLRELRPLTKSSVAYKSTFTDQLRMNQSTQMAANACVSTGELDKEIKDREKLSKSSPKNAKNWLALGKAYERANNSQKAKEAFKKAAEFGDEAIKREAEDSLKRLGS
jgi:tetratricopeptide (TPR) repeat protein